MCMIFFPFHFQIEYILLLAIYTSYVDSLGNNCLIGRPRHFMLYQCHLIIENEGFNQI